MMRNMIRDIMKRFGYDIVKTGTAYIPSTTKDVLVKVGNFEILMPGNNVQHINYRIYPELNSTLGRLAQAIHHKYPNMTVVDVGANVGDTIAVLKTAVDIPVIGIEGDAISHRYLEKNVTQFSNVKIIKTYLGEKSSVTNVNLEKSGWNTTIIPDTAGELQLTFKSLDETLSLSGNSNTEIKLLKVDVEGFDTIVLRGSMELIDKQKPVLFFEYNCANMIAINEDGLHTILEFKKLGYHKIAFFDHKGSLILATDMKNEEVITYLHEYASSTKNLIGYYDICIFHEFDTTVAEEFLINEKKYI